MHERRATEEWGKREYRKRHAEHRVEVRTQNDRIQYQIRAIITHAYNSF